MFGLSMMELVVILAIVLLIFGPKRLKNIGSDLGNAIKGFRTAVTDEEKTEAPEAKVIEGEATQQSAEEAPQQQKTSV